MNVGTLISNGVNTLTLGAVGHRDPEVKTFIVHADGTKSEENYFPESQDSDIDNRFGLGAGLAGAATLAIGGQAALSAMAGASGTSMIGKLFASTAFSAMATIGIRAAQIGVVGLATTGAIGVLLAQAGEPLPGMDWLTDRMKSGEVEQVYYTEAGVKIGSEIVTRESYEADKKAAEYWTAS